MACENLQCEKAVRIRELLMNPKSGENKTRMTPVPQIDAGYF